MKCRLLRLRVRLLRFLCPAFGHMPYYYFEPDHGVTLWSCKCGREIGIWP